jgi:hypothetical protein
MKKVDISTKKYPNIFALVDDNEYERINKNHWYVMSSKKNLYAVRTKGKRGKTKTILMHRELLGYEGTLLIDHRDHNTLNNKKDNLRICTTSQNTMNMIRTKKESSIYKGVFYDKERNKWQTNIMRNYKKIFIGRYGKEKDAAKAYNKAAIKYHGEFACLNEV